MGDRLLNGEPYANPLHESLWEGCCDCGLVHLVFINEVARGVVSQTSYRDDFRTLEDRTKKPISEWRQLFQRLEEVFNERGYDFKYTLKRKKK